MLIVDSQIHLWAASTPQRPWPAPGAGGRTAKAHRDVPIDIQGALAEMDAAGVNAAVIVPPSWEGEYNDVALEAARQYPQRFAVMGRLDTARPDAPAQVARWNSQPGMLGMRLMLPAQSPILTGGADYWVWAAAEKADVAITVAVRGHFEMMGEVARRHPGLRLSIDHVGAESSYKDAEALKGMPELLKLARFPNMAVKVSGLPCISTDPYPFRNMHAYVRQVYDAFGPQRMFWGVDLSRLPCTYRQSVTMFTEEMPWLRGGDLELVMGRALCAWWRWKLQS